MKVDRKKRVSPTVAMVFGVVAGLTVGGAFAVAAPWADHDASVGAASAAEEPEPEPAPSLDPGEPELAPGEGPLAEGSVALDGDVPTMESDVQLGSSRSLEGAAAAFSSYAVWAISSPAAGTDPAAVPQVVGRGELNPADAELLAGMSRTGSDLLDAPKGAYRVVGYAGDESAPEQVMVEIAAPLTLVDTTRWAVVGGVVKWSDGHWVASALQPREIEQPQSSEARNFSEQERASTLEGLAWQLFSTENVQ